MIQQGRSDGKGTSSTGALWIPVDEADPDLLAELAEFTEERTGFGGRRVRPADEIRGGERSS